MTPWLVAVVALLFAAAPATATADDGHARATVQDRFAPKEGRFFGHVAGTAFVRDDFYRSLGYGLDVGYFFNETVGIEARGYHVVSRLSHSGEHIRDDHNMVPDMRAPQAMFTAGGRFSWGYGKVLTVGRWVVHFDPQATIHGGITLAEERVVPTATAGLGFLTHWQHGIQVKLDLQMSLHVEQRDRGTVAATGFAPVLALGWSPGFGGRD